MIGIALALASALSWGSGDFFGGLAARKLNQFQVLLLTTASSLLLLILLSIVLTESLPSTRDAFIAVLAGLSGALGLASLYRGLSVGNSALVAPVAGVISAIVPTLVGLIIEGLPGFITLIGFVLTIAGIWLVTSANKNDDHYSRDGLGLAMLAGVGFGGFLALIAQVEGEQVFTPLVFAKFASLALALLLIRLRRLPVPNPAGSPVAILSGVLDTGGNVLYVLATQFARLDVAALLASLYPAATVLLSSLILKEKITPRQWLGAGICIIAIILITAGT